VSARPNGPWLRLSAHYWEDHRVLMVSADAELVWVRSLAYCKGHQTGGVVRSEVLALIGLKAADPSACAAELTTAGLWETTRAGWRIPPEAWARWQDDPAPSDGQRMRNRAAAHVMHHKNGRHARAPRTECPLCLAAEEEF
jgi:hypothetical protein